MVGLGVIILKCYYSIIYSFFSNLILLHITTICTSSLYLYNKTYLPCLSCLIVNEWSLLVTTYIYRCYIETSAFLFAPFFEVYFGCVYTPKLVMISCEIMWIENTLVLRGRFSHVRQEHQC